MSRTVGCFNKIGCLDVEPLRPTCAGTPVHSCWSSSTRQCSTKSELALCATKKPDRSRVRCGKPNVKPSPIGVPYWAAYPFEWDNLKGSPNGWWDGFDHITGDGSYYVDIENPSNPQMDCWTSLQILSNVLGFLPASVSESCLFPGQASGFGDLR